MSGVPIPYSFELLKSFRKGDIQPSTSTNDLSSEADSDELSSQIDGEGDLDQHKRSAQSNANASSSQSNPRILETLRSTEESVKILVLENELNKIRLSRIEDKLDDILSIFSHPRFQQEAIVAPKDERKDATKLQFTPSVKRNLDNNTSIRSSTPSNNAIATRNPIVYVRHAQIFSSIIIGIVSTILKDIQKEYDTLFVTPLGDQHNSLTNTIETIVRAMKKEFKLPDVLHNQRLLNSVKKYEQDSILLIGVKFIKQLYDDSDLSPIYKALVSLLQYLRKVSLVLIPSMSDVIRSLGYHIIKGDKFDIDISKIRQRSLTSHETVVKNFTLAYKTRFIDGVLTGESQEDYCLEIEQEMADSKRTKKVVVKAERPKEGFEFM